MGFIIATLGTLGAIAASLGLQKATEAIEENRSSKKKVTPADITSIVDNMASEAKSKGSKIYNELMGKISALNLPLVHSPAVKEVIQNRKRELSEKAKTLSDGLNSVESKLAPLSQQANSLAYMSDRFRSSKAGQQKLEDIKSTAQTHINDLGKIIQGVENNV